ncbi:MAG: hypothetical protein GX100_02620 [candidate division WS1 bacterium]|nr:hypothetical protein [candidate division WS1 bacterium]
MTKLAAFIVAFVMLVAPTTGAAYPLSVFPFNGGFERVESNQPQGWEATGTWLMGAVAPCEGRKFVYLAPAVARTGDRLVSQGYRLVKPGSTVFLTASYQSSTGGALFGLVLCDGLGQPLGEILAAPQPAAPTWRQVALSFPVPACAGDDLAAVRIMLGVSGADKGADFDDISLTAPQHVVCPTPHRPTLDVLRRRNLLPNPTLIPDASDGVYGWNRLIVPDTTETAWTSVPLSLDLALPYGLTAEATDGTQDGFSLLLRVRDPLDPASVWLQTPPVTGGPARLPRLAREPERGLVEAAILPVAGQALGQLELALRPEPISLSIRPVAMAGEFTRPQDVQLFVSAINNTDTDLSPMAYLKILDADGQQAAYEPRRVRLGPHSAAYFPYKPTLTRAGKYVMLTRLMYEGQDLGFITFPFEVTGG